MPVREQCKETQQRKQEHVSTSVNNTTVLHRRDLGKKSLLRLLYQDANKQSTGLDSVSNETKQRKREQDSTSVSGSNSHGLKPSFPAKGNKNSFILTVQVCCSCEAPEKGPEEPEHNKDKVMVKIKLRLTES